MIRIYLYGQKVPRYILKPQNCVVRFAGLLTVVYRRKGKTYIAPIIGVHAFEIEDGSDLYGFMIPGRWM